MATRAAATTPASRPTRARVAAYTTGTVATPTIAEVARTATSEYPKTRTQTHSNAK